MNTAAIVTIAIGEPHLSNWTRFCSENWKSYAARHSLDLIVVTDPLIQSDRPIPWQKCLILGQPFAANYRQIAILDSDIAINPDSPNIFDQLPSDRIGGTTGGSHIHEDLRPVLLSRLSNKTLRYDRDSSQGQHTQWQRDQDWFYEEYGLSPRPEGIINTGVLVTNPEKHAGLFRPIFDLPCKETRLYEQIPLSHAILTAGLFQQIDSRFNSIVFETLLVHHHYLFTQALGEHVTRAIICAEFANNFFLHFAYDQSLMRFLRD